MVTKSVIPCITVSQNWVGFPSSYCIEFNYKTPSVQILNYYHFLSTQQHNSIPLYHHEADFPVQHKHNYKKPISPTYIAMLLRHTVFLGP